MMQRSSPTHGPLDPRAVPGARTSSVAIAQRSQAVPEPHASLEGGQLSITVLPQRAGADDCHLENLRRRRRCRVGPARRKRAPLVARRDRTREPRRRARLLRAQPAPLISGNGAIIAGNRLCPTTKAGFGACRPRGPRPPAGARSTADAVPSPAWSACPGTALVRRLRLERQGDLLMQPWVWTMEQGQTLLPVVLPTYGGEAWAACEDGRVVVGRRFDSRTHPTCTALLPTRSAEGTCAR